MSTDVFEEKYGPRHQDVTQILADIHRLDEEKAHLLTLLSREIEYPESHTVLTAAGMAGIEEQVLRASTDCHQEVWAVVWEGSTKEQAFTVAMAAAKAGMGAAAGGIIGLHQYGLEDHLALTADWYAVFDHAQEVSDG
jgi:hypothetical protein